MMLRHVTVNEIVHAIEELMGDCQYNHPDRVLLYYADSFYDKLNDYCAMVEEGVSSPE